MTIKVPKAVSGTHLRDIVDIQLEDGWAIDKFWEDERNYVLGFVARK